MRINSRINNIFDYLSFQMTCWQEKWSVYTYSKIKDVRQPRNGFLPHDWPVISIQLSQKEACDIWRRFQPIIFLLLQLWISELMMHEKNYIQSPGKDTILEITCKE